MSSENNTTELPKESRRIALHTKTTLRFTHFEGFVTEYSSNLSMTGMFIRSDNPQEPGTVFDFEFKVADGLKLIQGKAEVIWARYEQQSADRPPGMGVTFVDLDNESKRLIRWIVERHVYEGGKPFELDDLRSVVDETLAGVEDQFTPEPDAPPAAAPPVGSFPVSDYVEPSFAQAAKEPTGVVAMRWAGITAAALVVLFLGFSGIPWLMERVDRSTSQRASNRTEAAETATTSETGSVSEAGSSTDGSETAVTATGEEAMSAEETQAIAGSADWNILTESIRNWAEAWSNQDVSGYLSFYGSEFVPPKGMTRPAWEQNRHERLGAPSFINVGLSNLEIENTGPESAQAKFTQTYRSSTFSDVVEKTLSLRWEDGGWKITSEASG